MCQRSYEDIYIWSILLIGACTFFTFSLLQQLQSCQELGFPQNPIQDLEMPDQFGNCAMNVPRMGICGRKPILVFFSPLPPPIVLIALVFFCSESTEGGGQRILGQWLVGSVPWRGSSFFLFSVCALLHSDWEVLCLLTSLFSAWWVGLLCLIIDISPRFPALSFLSLMNHLQSPS